MLEFVLSCWEVFLSTSDLELGLGIVTLEGRGPIFVIWTYLVGSLELENRSGTSERKLID